MKRIKRFFVIVLGVVAFPFIKIASVFGAEPINTNIWGQAEDFLYNSDSRMATLYGVPEWEFEEKVLYKILWTLVIILVPVVVLGFRAYFNMKKKKKQQQNMNQNTQQNNNIQK